MWLLAEFFLCSRKFFEAENMFIQLQFGFFLLFDQSYLNIEINVLSSRITFSTSYQTSVQTLVINTKCLKMTVKGLQVSQFPIYLEDLITELLVY